MRYSGTIQPALHAITKLRSPQALHLIRETLSLQTLYTPLTKTSNSICKNWATPKMLHITTRQPFPQAQHVTTGLYSMQTQRCWRWTTNPQASHVTVPANTVSNK